MHLPTRLLAAAACALIAAGCDVPPTGAGNGSLPEQVAGLAAPGQNLATARLVPEDNCYWYEHSGPVETTLLPLRTPDGRPICAPRAA